MSFLKKQSSEKVFFSEVRTVNRNSISQDLLKQIDH